MNDFQLHLNDNSFQKEYPNATVEIAKKAYSGFRLESTIKEGGLNQADLTSKERDYPDVDRMRQIAERSLQEGMREALAFAVENQAARRLPLCKDTCMAYNEYLEETSTGSHHKES